MAIPPPPPGFRLDAPQQPNMANVLGRPVVVPGPKQPPAQTPTQEEIDRLRAEELRRSVSQPQLTPAQKAVDEKFAEHYVDWNALGGWANAAKQLGALREQSRRLKNENVTGPIIGMTPNPVLKIVNPNAAAVQQGVEETIQQSLRQTLGAQFTEREGQALIQRTYDPSLPEAENRKRVARLRSQLTLAAAAKNAASKYYEKHGTLQGWKGKIWGINDFDPKRNAVAPPKPAKSSGIARISGDEDYDRLPSGATFVGPDGQTRRKP